MASDGITAVRDDEIRDNKKRDAKKTKLLGRRGKNGVALNFWKVTKFLNRLTKPHPKKSTVANGNEGLFDLKTDIERVQIGVKKSQKTIPDVFLAHDNGVGH